MSNYEFWVEVNEKFDFTNRDILTRKTKKTKIRMDEENKVPNFLKNYNIELGSHILYDSAASKFLSWLAENITDENVLNDDELRDYYEMEQAASTCEQQEILYGEDLKKLIEERNKKFPNLTTYTDTDIEKCENELDYVTELSQHYNELLNDNIALLSETKIKNFQLNKKLNHVKEQEERLNTECLQNLKEAQEIHNHIQKCRQDIESVCSCVQVAPCYMHQFPLEEIFSKCRDFNNYCDQYLRKSFEVIDSNMSDSDIGSTPGEDIYTTEIESIKQVLNTSTYNFKMAEMKLSSLKKVIKELESFNRISYDYEDMKQELEQMKLENKEMNIKVIDLKVTLKKSTDKLNQQKINSLIHDANSHKIQRAQQRLKDIEAIENISDQFTLLCEILWLSVNFDTDMLNMYKNVLKEDTIEERNHLICLKRIEKLNSLLLEDPVANYTTEFCSEIAKKLTRSNFNQVSLKEYDDMVASITIQLDAISNKSDYSDINQMIQLLDKNSSVQFKFLDDGPLARPQVVDADIMHTIYKYNIEIEKSTKTMNVQRKTYKELQAKLNSNKIWKYSNLLWIWFLTEPKRVIDAIEEIKSLESRSRKAISGILCKRN